MKKQTFKPCLPRKITTGKGFRLLGFSVAEAMVTLLIVSIALAAAAPIMSRSMKNNISSQFPSGAVMAFDLTYCPVGWTPLSSKYANSDGAFIRNMGGNAGELGRIQNDAVPDIIGRIEYNLTSSASTTGEDTDESRSTVIDGVFSTYGRYPYDKTATVNRGAVNDDVPTHPWREYHIQFKASDYTKPYGSGETTPYGRDDTKEVRPKNITLLYCRKD